MTPLDYWPIVLGAAIIALVGFLRRDRLLIVAMTTGGYVMVLLALMWSWELGPDARYAILLAAFGATLTTMGTERSRLDKRRRSPQSNESVGRS